MHIFITYFSNYFIDITNPSFFFHFWHVAPTIFLIPFSIFIIRYYIATFVVWIVANLFPKFWNQPQFNSAFGYPLISVLIPCRNEGAGLDAAIRSVLGCGWPNLEIIVADDFSTDESWRFAKEFESTGRVRLFRLSRHGGRATVLNLLVATASADYIMMFDSDTVLTPNVLQRMMGVLTSDPKIGGVGCTLGIFNGDDSLTATYQEWLYSIAFPVQRTVRSWLGFVNNISGACGLFRAEAMRGVGVYDPGLGDDTDLALRLRKGGWKLVHVPSAVALTRAHTTLKGFIKQQMRWERVLVKVRFRKHWDMILPWRYGWKNALLTLDMVITRIVIPPLSVAGILMWTLTDPFTTATLLSDAYWIGLFLSLLRGFIVRETFGRPRWIVFAYVPIFFIFQIPMRAGILYAFFAEQFRIGSKHPYIPDHLWQAGPRW